MLQDLQNAEWLFKKKKAKLVCEADTLIEIEFKRKISVVTFEKKQLEISKDGFWCPKVIIWDNEKVIAVQKQLGLWGSRSHFAIDDQKYYVRTKQGSLFNITYSNNTADIVTYKLNTFKNKPKITFQVTSYEVPEKHLLLLLAVGFYSIKNVAAEAISNNFIITAVA